MRFKANHLKSPISNWVINQLIIVRGDVGAEAIAFGFEFRQGRRHHAISSHQRAIIGCLNIDHMRQMFQTLRAQNTLVHPLKNRGGAAGR